MIFTLSRKEILKGLSVNERDAYIAFNMMDRIGPVTVRRLIDEYGTASEAFQQGYSDRDVNWADELERVESMGARIITQVDSEYPPHLLEIYDPPLALYVLGRLEAGDKHSIAVVGTRRPSHYGRETAARLTRQMAMSGLTIVSGLAEGIDTVAHEAALEASGRTIAVLGGALDCLFPKSNTDLAERISNHGAVLSEFPLGRHPDKTTFPMRNRIVSGLSEGVLVVEAGRKSGALITANQALDQGRSVFAVPGRVDSPLSVGAHGLIKNGARLVETVDDILQEYEFLFSGINAASGSDRGKERPRPVLSSEENVLVELLSDGEMNVDALIRGSGMKSSSVSGLLIGLEMKKIVRMLPGGIVERN